MQSKRILLDTLTVFTSESDDVLAALKALLATAETPEEGVRNYASLLRALIAENPDADLTSAIEHAVLHADNVYTRAAARRTNIAAHIAAAARRDIEILASLSQIPAAEFKKILAKSNPDADWIRALPEYATHPTSLSAEAVRDYCMNNGAGIFSRAHGFVYSEKDGLVAVRSVDPIRLCDLKNYEEQRGEVVENTRAFLDGLPAQNVLLYGDRGTGKSSTVKAILNEFGDRGLRMIELDKSSLKSLDRLLAVLHGFPMKFVIFIDDLSFNEGDDTFGILKAALEGSLVSRPDNVVIYATSNRRHLVRETFSAREGNEIHAADTRDEALSLSDRFGLTVTFLRPSKRDYLDIAHRLAQDFGVDSSDAEFDLGAEQWAMLNGGRSPRVAKQYVRSLLAKRG